MTAASATSWRVRVAVAVGLLLAPLAAAASPAAVASDRDDTLAQLEEQALDDWGSRRYPRAVAGWDRLIAAEPARRRYRLGLVRTLVSSGEIQRARAELVDAAAVAASEASDEHNTLVAEGELLRAEQQDRLAADAFGEAAALAGRDPRARGGAATASAAGPRPWRFNSGLILDHFSNSRGDESQVVFDLGYRFHAGLATYLLYEQHRRFNATDPVYIAGAALRAGDHFALRLNLGGSPDPAFRPQLEGTVRVEWLATEFLHPLLGYQVLDYADGLVRTWTPGLRILAEGANVELLYALTEETDGSDTGTAGLRLDWILARNWAPSFTYQRGEEALPPQARAEFQRVGAGVTWRASQVWQLRLDYGYEHREAAYIAHTLAFGLGLNF